MKVIETKSLLVKSTNYGESDKIVTLITEDLGKVQGIAKGARRSIKRFGGCLEQFTLVNMTIRPKKGLSFIEEGRVIKNFKAIKSDLNKIAYGSYILELTSTMSLEGETHEGRPLYELLINGIEEMEHSKKPEETAREYDMKILSKMGYMPSLLICVICDKKLLDANGQTFSKAPLAAGRHEALKVTSCYNKEFYRPTAGSYSKDNLLSSSVGFSWARGGILCGDCHKKTDEELNYVSVGTLKTLNAAAFRPVSFTINALSESEMIIPSFIAYHLGTKLKSLDFIKSMKGA